MKRQYVEPKVSLCEENIMEGIFAAMGACPGPNGTLAMMSSGYKVERGTCKNTFFSWAGGLFGLDDEDDIDVEE